MNGTTRRGLLAAPALLAAAGSAGAQTRAEWPNGTIRFIGIFPPGGGTDIISRIWCQKMTEITGEQFVVENRSGSAGNIGTEAIARAAPDGRTIGLASVAPLAIGPTLYRRLPFDVTKDFTYVSGLWQLPNLLTIHPDVPARTVPELIALVKANPGKFSYASSGSGTTVHISGAMFAAMAGLDMVHVPYRGGAPATLAIVAREVPVMFNGPASIKEQVEAGKLRVLAVTGKSRSPSFPAAPTIAESGYPAFNVVNWYGLLAPAGTPQDIVEKIRADVAKVMVQPEFLDWMAKQGIEPMPGGPAEFRSLIVSEIDRLGAVVKASGAKLE